MKAIIRGLKLIDYVKKDTGEQIKGVEVQLTAKSSDCIGEEAKQLYIKDKTSFYYDIVKYLEGDVSDIIGCDVVIDYDVQKRGNYTRTDIVGFDIIPKKKTA